MKGTRNDYRQRRNARRGRLAFQNIQLAFLSMAAFVQNEANDKRAARVLVSKRRDLVVRYDPATDETVTLSEYRREQPHISRSKYTPGYPRDYNQRSGVVLKRHSGIVKPVGVLGILKGRLFGPDGVQLP